jgi:type I restriction enzyme M protein
MTKNKKEQHFKDQTRNHRNREGETLFIDARNMGTMVDRTHKELTTDDLAIITRTYHAWRGESKDGIYEDIAGYCKSATLTEIEKNDFALNPGRYVEVAEEEGDGIPFETKMTDLSTTLFSQMDEAQSLDSAIRNNLKQLGYE